MPKIILEQSIQTKNNLYVKILPQTEENHAGKKILEFVTTDTDIYLYTYIRELY